MFDNRCHWSTCRNCTNNLIYEDRKTTEIKTLDLRGPLYSARFFFALSSTVAVAEYPGLYLPGSCSAARMGGVWFSETSVSPSQPTRLTFHKTVVLIFSAIRNCKTALLAGVKNQMENLF